MEIPRDYNAAYDLIERNLWPGAAARSPTSTTAGRYTYASWRSASTARPMRLRSLGLAARRAHRIAMLDTIDFGVFLGAIKAGIVPVAAEHAAHHRRLQVHARGQPRDARWSSRRRCCRASRRSSQPAVPQARHRSARMRTASASARPAGKAARHSRPRRPRATTSASGSTRPARPARRRARCTCIRSLIQTAELYARPVLGIREDDVVFSAAKLFFAYGLGNALTFPLAVGATAVLMAERPTPAAVFKRLQGASADDLLRRADAVRSDARQPRAARSATSSPCASAPRRAKRCRPTSAGAGPSTSASRSSTASARPRCCTSSSPIAPATCATAPPASRCPATRCAWSTSTATRSRAGELGELQISGPTSAIQYWNNAREDLATFSGPWTRSGDKYSVDEDGYYTYGGRSDDMLKVERHVRVAVRGRGRAGDAPGRARSGGGRRRRRAAADQAEGVRRTQSRACAATMRWPRQLKQHVKDRLAPYKYPRWIEFLPELPKTATGKIQRFKLRA